MGGNNGTRGSVIITGASTGIGRECALYLDRLGYRVFAGVRKAQDGHALKQKASDRMTPLFLDVTDPSSLAAAGAAVRETEAPGLAGLVNNAGIVVAGPIEFVPLEDLRRQWEVNVLGQVAVIQTFLPLLRKAGGRIVNMGSISGRYAAPFLGPYAASKFALEALTDSLRVELHGSGIQVSIIEPGDVATPIWEKSISAADQRLRNFPPEAFTYYGAAFAAVRSSAENSARTAFSAAVVAKTVVKALTARRPKTRYLVGRRAAVQALFHKLLPDRLFDRLVLRSLRLSR